MNEEVDLVEVTLREIQATESHGAQIMILGEIDGERQFPIFIGPYEMDAIDRALHGKETIRPLTHDLIINVLDGTQCELVRILIDDLNEDTFYAKLVVKMPDGAEAFIDSRPSDALVLAARRSVPIFAAETILETIGQPPADSDFD